MKHIMTESVLTKIASVPLSGRVKEMKNVFDPRNREMSFLEKMRYNQRIISTEEFQFCLEHASLAYENPFLIKMLKSKNYYAYWLLEKAAQIKNRIGGVFK